MTGDQVRTLIEQARAEDARALSSLHASCLPGGLLTSLGPRFLPNLYRALVEAPTAIVLAAREGPVVGFAAAATSPSEVWRSVARRRPLSLGGPLLLRAARPGLLREAMRLRRDLDDAEEGAQLLAIAVGPPARRNGLGSTLVADLVEELRARGVQRLWVAVRGDNDRARSFFGRLGFHPLGRIERVGGVPGLRYERVL